MGCYLEDYRARVGTWAGRYTWRGVPKRGDANRDTGHCLGLTMLSSMVLAAQVLCPTTGIIRSNLWRSSYPPKAATCGAAASRREQRIVGQQPIARTGQ